MQVRQEEARRPAPHELVAGALGIAVSYLLLFELNQRVFAAAEVNDHVSWIYLPAAIRMLAVMLFEWTGVLGLFLGSLLCYVLNPEMIANPYESLSVATLSSVGPMVAFVAVRRIVGLPRELAGLTAGHLAIFAVAGGLVNALLHQGYFFLIDKEGAHWVDVIPMFVGDVIGSLAMLYLASAILRLLRRSAH